jgi:uncharacterized protein
MMKALRLGIALALGASCGSAVDWQARYPKPEGSLSDFARMIDAATRGRIDAYAASLEKATGVQLSLVTIPSVDREPIEDVAATIFRGWGTDGQAKDNGILLLLSTGDHWSRLEVGRDLTAILPAGLAGQVLDEMRPAVQKNDVADAMIAAAQTIGDAVARARHVRLDARLTRRHLPQFFDSVNWMLVAGIVALVVLFSRVPGPDGLRGGLGAVPWLIFGHRTGWRSCYGSRGSGGFGGFDSGDGFGGFGGGDSGCGRASSDW